MAIRDQELVLVSPVKQSASRRTRPVHIVMLSTYAAHTYAYACFRESDHRIPPQVRMPILMLFDIGFLLCSLPSHINPHGPGRCRGAIYNTVNVQVLASAKAL
jgi:hypothetical protein